ncbi:putative C2 domain-containing protein [Medicago truncatula]|uniref:C2 domain protein n=1 Tax=Medicago truncatula TaxID=3880 RepID=B7FIF5_MEDTR|nr:elicitor-responsive protein 1 [Medicago truncatula]ACJ84534.1 unknown [Medicago truncatula]KEH27312.1 C2 domain protein [Medicago truncatula]RHN53213.1 putative C2 domain-containing protein [Medicago truncatula]
MMSSGTIAGIQGQPLEVTVVCCSKLKDTEWISRQDPYVCLEYATNKFRTKTCTDGGKNPVFQEKFVFSLIEGLREINVAVWNYNTVTSDDFIGTGKVQLHKVLSQGFDDSAWPLQTKNGRHAGEVKLIMHYANAKVNHQKPAGSSSHIPYMATPPAVPLYNQVPSYYPQQQPHSNYHNPAIPAAAASAYPPPPSYPAASHNPSPYPPPPPSPYPPPHSYPPSSAYPPPSYPPPTGYPPNAGFYPPPY